jgi:hypothetical protein
MGEVLELFPKDDPSKGGSTVGDRFGFRLQRKYLSSPS